jgi:hypothetical protein
MNCWYVFKISKNNTSEGSIKERTNMPIITLMALPASVKECTEVSPNTPVRVRKVE